MPISEVVIADSSPFIHLERIGRLDLLPRVFGHVGVPATIADDVSAGRAHGVNASDLRALPWVTVHPDMIDPVVAAEPGLHAGEVTALSLARGTKDHLLIVDDRAGRVAATKAAPALHRNGGRGDQGQARWVHQCCRSGLR